MGLFEDLIAQGMSDPQFARAYTESYQEGIHSAWSMALMTGDEPKNEVANAESMGVCFAGAELLITQNRSPKIESITATA